MQLRRALRWSVVMAAASAAMLAATVTPAAAVDPPGYCSSRMADTAPRWFSVFTTDTGDGVAGGSSQGYIWVDRRSDIGYNVCVGWSDFAVVEDRDGDGWGAAAYASYDEWNGYSWGRVDWDLMARADGEGAVTGYTALYNVPVRNFYVRVCRIQLSTGHPHSNCSAPE